MANRLNDKVALVTGAGSGMGKQIAIDFLKEGCKVCALDIIPERLEELKEDVADEGLDSDSLVSIVGNICNPEDCDAAVKLCVDTFGYMNVLSHNAGVSDKFDMVENLPEEEWNRVIAINLTGSMHITRSALQYLVPKAEEDEDFTASIVMITSNAAFESSTGGPAYCASKAGANALMKSIAFEYKRIGIRCNSICPGPVLTNIVANTNVFNEAGAKVHNGTGYNRHSWEWTGGEIGMPDQISPLAVYLASDESLFMNGNSCVIDSGVCLSR